MGPSDIFEYATEGMKWLAVGGGSYFGALISCQLLDLRPTLKRIESQEELDEVLAEESEKLGLDINTIEAKIRGSYISNVQKKNNKIQMQFSHRLPLTIPVVRHELYHVLKDTDRLENGKMNSLYYLFVAEPRATLYGTFSIKI